MLPYLCILQIKFERQKRLKRIKEMETTICTKLGEICEVCVSSQASHLPSEDELKQYLRRVEDLEITLVSVFFSAVLCGIVRSNLHCLCEE